MLPMPTTNNGSGNRYVVDCDALVTISQTKNNAIRATALRLLEAGTMKVPTAVVHELKEAFEDEFEDLSPHIKGKIKIKPAHTVKVASLASKSNSGFKIEPYGSADWVAAAVAECEGCILVTTKGREAFYTTILNCTVMTVDDLPVDSE
jgi:hypothetical protein